MSKRKNESKKRINSLILLIAFTAILLIVSTYAWFSTQKDVSITNLQGQVQVSEGLQISMDAVKWGQVIDLSGGNLKTNGWDGNNNLEPKDYMNPLSTTGALLTGNTGLALFKGDHTDGNKLSAISAVSETGTNGKVNDGFFAFDIFLKNATKVDGSGVVQGTTTDAAAHKTTNTLQLNYNSVVDLIANGSDTTDFGLQNTVRVAFALSTGSAAITDNATSIIAKTATGQTFSKVAIWEPNASSHIDYVVTNNNIIKGLADIGATNISDGKFTATSVLPTYAVKSATPASISDIYDYTTAGLTKSKLEKQNALQTTRGTGTLDEKTITLVNEGVQNLVAANDGTTTFEIPANAICRVRVYVWLEGQDVDCINQASYAKGVNVNIGLVKDATVGSFGSATKTGT